MPIRRSKSLLELCRRVNRLLREQRRRPDTDTWTAEVKRGSRIFFLGVTRQNKRITQGDPKRGESGNADVKHRAIDKK
jgi:hypothetical protein